VNNARLPGLPAWPSFAIALALCLAALPTLCVAAADFSGKWLVTGVSPALRAKPTARIDDPTARCLPPGLSRLYSIAQPFLIMHAKGQVLYFFQFQRLHRRIYLAGSEPVGEDPSYLGSSVARWQGDTLVVQTANFKSGGWLDAAGTPYSESLRLTERWRLRNANTLAVDMTIDDAANSTAMRTTSFVFKRQAGTEIDEDVCADRTFPERVRKQEQMDGAATQ
jgi:hypothetical protein